MSADEAAAAVVSASSYAPDNDPAVLLLESQQPLSLGERLSRIVRLSWRCSYLALLSTPLVLSYPLSLLSTDWKAWWLNLCLTTTQYGGAIVVKLSQWASSRPDLFGEEFCDVFCKLQDQAVTHSWQSTRDTLARDFGPDWEANLQLDHEPIGSGSIAQVYRGRVTMPGGLEWGQTVAVKVLHPGVGDTVEVDFDVLRGVAWGLCQLPFGLGERMLWLNARGMVEEFGGLLEGQLDLREEAANLVRFNENFKGRQFGVRFPRSIEGWTDHSTQSVLIEEFIEGLPVAKWVANHEDKQLRENLSARGIRAICKMIFHDNFVHGDLHPGNILISKENEIVMLDVGISKQFAKKDHDLLVKVLTCFISSNGRQAAAHMAENSDLRMGTRSKPEDVAQFADKIEAMVNKAKTDDSFFCSLGDYFKTICSAASTHHVKMNQGFITMAIAVKVMEGIALELDPDIEVWSIAQPILLQGTASRKWREAFHDLADFWLPDRAHTEWSHVKNFLRALSLTIG